MIIKDTERLLIVFFNSLVSLYSKVFYLKNRKGAIRMLSTINKFWFSQFMSKLLAYSLLFFKITAKFQKDLKSIFLITEVLLNSLLLIKKI